MTTATIAARAVPERRANGVPKWKVPFFYDKRLAELRAEIARNQADVEVLRRSRAKLDAALNRVELIRGGADSKEPGK